GTGLDGAEPGRNWLFGDWHRTGAAPDPDVTTDVSLRNVHRASGAGRTRRFPVRRALLALAFRRGAWASVPGRHDRSCPAGGARRIRRRRGRCRQEVHGRVLAADAAGWRLNFASARQVLLTATLPAATPSRRRSSRRLPRTAATQ